MELYDKSLWKKATLKVILYYILIGTFLIIIYRLLFNTNDFFSGNFANYDEWIFLIFSGLLFLGLAMMEFRHQCKIIADRLFEANDRYTRLFENASDAIFLLNDDTVIDCNQKAFELIARPRFQVIGKSFVSLSAQKQTDNSLTTDTFNCILNGLQTGNFHSTYWFLSTPEGRLVDVLATFSFISLDGKPYVQVIAKDLTKRVKDQLKIKEREQEYRDIVESAHSAIIKFDLNGNLLFINAYAEQLYGYKLSEIKGRSIFDVFRPHLLPHRKNVVITNSGKLLQRIIRNILTEPVSQNWNFTKSGKRIFMNWTNKPIYDIQKNLIGVLSIGIDQTEQKIMLDRLFESERKFKLIFNEVTDGITILSYSGEIIEQNKAGLGFLGFDKSDLQNHVSTQKRIKALVPNVDEIIRQVIEKNEIAFEIDVVSPRNEQITVEFVAKTSMYNNTPVIIAVSRDITDRKNFQMKVLKAAVDAEERERSRVAKELHDSISPILSTAKLYAQTLQDTQKVELKVEIIKKVERSINEAIQSIYEISNNLSPHILENFGIQEAIYSFIDKLPDEKIICEVKSNVQERFSKEVEITLYRVAIELINNTLKHAKASKIYITFNKNSHILMTYQDNGKGFNLSEVQKNSKGMGIFNISNRIQSLNGKIQISSTPEFGIIVQVSIPINHE